jgi:hypothetical protein
MTPPMPATGEDFTTSSASMVIRKPSRLSFL